MFTTAGSSTTLTSFLRRGSNHWLATMPECQPLRPDNSTEWPGPVSVLPWRYIAFEKIAPRSSRVLNPPR
jgi:hypothetical protein